jgi:mono/diheme cytochrome c family protein
MRGLLLLCLMAAPAAAQCVRTSGGYCAPAFAQSYYQPVYQAPAVNYAIQHYDQVAVVAKAVPVYLPLLAYSSVSDDARQYYGQKRAIKEAYLEAMREAAAEGLLGPAAQPIPQAQPGPLPPNPPVAVPQPERLPQVPKGPEAKGKVSIQKVLATRCASCHNPKDNPERLDLTRNPSTIPGEERNLSVVFVTSGKMPPKSPLPQEEYDELVAWALNGRSVAKAPQPADKK